MASLFIKNIGTLVSCDDNDTVYNDVNMLIENEEITYIGEDERQADSVYDAEGMIMYPGLINSHHHLYQIFSRNLPQVQNLELFDWLVTLYEIWKNLDKSWIRSTSQVGMGEFLKTGCTTCFDHHYVFPEGADLLIDTQFETALELGIRMHASRGSMSLSKKDGGLPPDSVVQTIDEILSDSERLIEKYHDAGRFSRMQIALAPCSPFSVTEDLMVNSAELARQYSVRLHTHLAETKDEENYILEKYGIRPIELMQRFGWVGSDVWFAHGIFFTDEEVDFLAETKTGVSHCPISNMKLSSGIAKIPRMIEKGVPVGLAVDGSASNDGSNLLEEIRVAYLLHRLNSSNNAPSGYDILKLATRGSAAVLGRDDIGKLQVGCAGDCFMIDTNRIELIGADFDAKSMLGTVGFKGSVDCTIVGGEVVVDNGRLMKVDEEKILSAAQKSLKKFYN